MATKKTIDINPDLFSTGSFSKTRKNKEKKAKITQVPLISPNKLRDKLLKRIKEHKSKEADTEIEIEPKNQFKLQINSQGINATNTDIVDKYSNEFNDSIEYLQTLSKQKKEQQAKVLQEKTLQKQREMLQRKTLKRPLTDSPYQSQSQSQSQSTMPIVNLELPDELKEPLPMVQINTQNINPHSNTFHIRPPQDVPYGVLKGGSKPTYREYLHKTQRNLVVNNPNSAVVIEGNVKNQNNVLNEREKRMNLLKEKMKKNAQIQGQPNISSLTTTTPTTQILESRALESQPLLHIQTPVFVPNNSNPLDNDIHLNLENSGTMIHDENVNTNNNNNTNNANNNNTNNTNNNTNNNNNNNNNNNTTTINGPMRRLIKKTIRRKYTLGKSKIKKSVAVLLKDRNTRKKVIDAQKGLKRKSMNDVKSYLREHNLIQLGSNAPNDVLRKMYESAMLTGEVTNNNKDTLLYNVLKENEENKNS